MTKSTPIPLGGGRKKSFSKRSISLKMVERYIITDGVSSIVASLLISCKFSFKVVKVVGMVRYTMAFGSLIPVVGGAFFTRQSNTIRHLEIFPAWMSIKSLICPNLKLECTCLVSLEDFLTRSWTCSEVIVKLSIGKYKSRVGYGKDFGARFEWGGLYIKFQPVTIIEW